MPHRKSGVFKKRKFSFVYKFKRDFEVKSRKDFRDFSRGRRIKRQNDRIETRVTGTIRSSRLHKFIQELTNDRGLVPSRKSKRFLNC